MWSVRIFYTANEVTLLAVFLNPNSPRKDKFIIPEEIAMGIGRNLVDGLMMTDIIITIIIIEKQTIDWCVYLLKLNIFHSSFLFQDQKI